MSTPDFCDKCTELRGADFATPLVQCKNRKHCLTEMICEYHCYEQYDMCSYCLQFIQDPINDEKLGEWEENHARKDKDDPSQ